MEWDRLRSFYYTAKEKNITRAADYLELSQSALSRSIQNLENDVKASLFIRHPRGLILTRQGEILFERVKNIMTEVEKAKNEISGITEEVTGTLTLTTSYAYASTVLAPYLCNFLKEHSEIGLNIVCDDLNLDLSKKHADVAIRTFDENTAELEQIFLHERTLKLFATQEYLDCMGIPEKPTDLKHHQFIVFDSRNTTLKNAQVMEWVLNLMMGPSIQGRVLKVNSVEILAQMAEAGLGIIPLSTDSLLLKKYTFVPVLPHIEGPRIKMYYSYLRSIEKLKVVQKLGEYLKHVLKEKED